ncbi:MAG: hypothetical protein IBX60_03420 [Candidatus Aminicenantes bacterium]|nr:hypothetical protein [Candidatus Aminicenantes bacterium]
MIVFKNPSGKIIPLLLVILILIIIAFGGGYYLSFTRFNQKFSQLNDRFNEFESKYEMVLSSLRSEQMETTAYIKEKEGKTQQETNQLRLMSILLKAKGEIISSKISLTRDEIKKSLEHLDSSIIVLRDAFDLADGNIKEKIEELRLKLATVKGIIEVNPSKAQQELDKLWREIDTLIEK